MAGWESAQERYEQQTRAWRVGRGVREHAGARLQAAAARVELFDVLVQDGWRPEPLVLAQIATDRELLAEAEVARLADGAAQDSRGAAARERPTG